MRDAQTGDAAKAELRGVVLELKAGSKTAAVTENGETREVEMPAAAAVERENVFAPLETVGDAFGLFTAFYPNEKHAKDVLVLSKKDLAVFKSPLNLYPVECLLTKVKGLREFVSMEVPKTLFELADIVPVIDMPAMDALTMMDADYTGKNGELYPRPEEAYRKEGVPQGKVTKFHMDDCKMYPEVQHDVWVYVPAQYDGKTPAKLLIITAGDFFLSNDTVIDLPAMLDNMINEGTLPGHGGAVRFCGRYRLRQPCLRRHRRPGQQLLPRTGLRG